MGKKDVAAKEYFSDPKVFADVFNYWIYDGRPVIQPENLTEVNPEELLTEKKKKRSGSSHRDLLRV